METTYKNPWHRPSDCSYGPAFYNTDAKPVSYKGYKIYNRIPGDVKRGTSCWDVVLNDICQAQFCGINGAKEFVDTQGDKVRYI